MSPEKLVAVVDRVGGATYNEKKPPEQWGGAVRRWQPSEAPGQPT